LDRRLARACDPHGLAILGGLIRMFAPVFAQREAQNTTAVYATLAVGLAVGLFLTFKAYSRESNTESTQAGNVIGAPVD